MSMDPAADREDLEPAVELDVEAEERAADEGMFPPEEDPEMVARTKLRPMRTARRTPGLTSGSDKR